MKLSPQLAQSIVNHMMGQIPYNINIMNEHGYIIASGDPKRINTLHVGAVDAIKQGKTLPMDSRHGNHGQPGVNMPITYNKQIIGVVGITGDPTKVVPLASLLKTAVELLLKQSAADQEKREHENIRQRFLYQWLQNTRHNEPSPDLINEGQKLNIDVTNSWTVVAIRCHPQELKKVNNDPQNLLLVQSNNIGLIIIHDPLIVKQLQKRLSKHSYSFGISNSSTLVGKGVEQAIRTLHFREDFQEPAISHYQQIYFIDSLLQSKLPLQPLVDKYNSLAQSQTGRDLITTIKEFIKCNLNVNQTAKHLFTHRNTINYRLIKIQEYFQLAPRKTTDLFQLFLGYLYFVQQKKK